MIVDYEYYTNVYHGDAVPKEEFDKYSQRAEKYLKYYAVKPFENPGEDIKNCICEMIDVYQEDSLNPRVVGSESLGGWSISGNAGSADAYLESRIENIIRLNLWQNEAFSRWL